MKISVIIPVYNCEKYLSACLESVLNQTYQNFEIVLVDDGSKDASGVICDQYAEKDDRICVVHQKNHGVSHARNTGMKQATGDAVSFIDSDDTLEPDMYELLSNVMLEHGADIAHCGFCRVESNMRKPIYGTGTLCVQNKGQALASFLAGDLFNGALWNKLFRIEILKGVCFREELRINEDVLFCFEAFQNAEKSVFTDQAKYNYYVRENSSACFTTPSDKKRKDGLWVSEYIYKTVVGTELEAYAADRYLRRLSAEYRYSKADRRCLAKQIRSISEKTSAVSRNMRITVAMIQWCPMGYVSLYGLYDRLRKPNWEV